MSKPIFARVLAAIGFLAVVDSAPDAVAQNNMRTVDVIATPGLNVQRDATADEIAAAQYPEVDRTVVNAAVERLLGSWGDGKLLEYLAPDFRGDIELVRNILAAAPADAKLRLLSLQSFYTVSQTLGTHAQLGPVVVSEVAVTANIQVELTNPFNGDFIRADGRNELLLRISRKIVPIVPVGG
ncbi:hypothetical protein [Inquilinus sp. CAU 1745]|uniref:hypothetical protein n=1 Tax=Inquilinus sp. CAU 1745 TaxID=3140369 RepID=UPI00325A5099